MSGGVKKKGNPQLRLRLPPDHWIWSFPASERNEIARKALDFYRQFGGELQTLKETAREIRELLLAGAVNMSPASPVWKKQKDEDRLLQSLDRLINL